MIVMIRLNNGEDLIGNLKIEDEKGIVLTGALILRYGYRQDGSPSMYFEKYNMFTYGFDVSFMNNQITHIFKDPLAGIVKHYKETLCKLISRYDTMGDKLIVDFEEEDDTMFNHIDDGNTRVH